MTDGQCQFCGQSSVQEIPSIEFHVCPTCLDSVRELLDPYLGDAENDIFGFIPVAHEYTPEDGEVFYLAPERQFYEVQIRGVRDTILFQPIPKNSEAIPIQNLAEELSEAMAVEEFYRVSQAVFPKENDRWWETAIALAPRPDKSTLMESEDEQEAVEMEDGEIQEGELTENENKGSDKTQLVTQSIDEPMPEDEKAEEAVEETIEDSEVAEISAEIGEQINFESVPKARED